MDARVLVKYSDSKCNKDLLDFLHENMADIKKKFKLKVLIVYDTSVLKGKIKRLPALIINGGVITGNSKIMDRLDARELVKKAEKKEPTINNYWKDILATGDEENPDSSMELAKAQATKMSLARASTSSSKKRLPVSDDGNEESPQSGNSISDMESDPIMKAYWERQEETEL